MRHGLFITGTDTGVGKTVVSCALAAAGRERGLNVGVYKPVETGCEYIEGKLVGADVSALVAAAGGTQDPGSACGYLFELPASPFAAAKAAGSEVCPEKIAEDIGSLSEVFDLVIVEGAGGLKVPVAEGVTWLEVIEDLDLPAICVVADKLGCINHALLTLDTLDHESVEVLGFAMSRTLRANNDPTRESNAAIIEAFSGARLLGALPYLSAQARMDNDTLARAAIDHLQLARIFDDLES